MRWRTPVVVAVEGSEAIRRNNALHAPNVADVLGYLLNATT